jgi:agmatinase
LSDKKNYLPDNFLGIPKPYSDYGNSRFVILPVPYEQTTTYKTGTKEGPQAIITASKQVELFDEELKTEAYKVGIYTAEELEPTSKGPEEMIKRIYRAGREFLKDRKVIVMLGGEHTVSIGMIKAYREKYKDLSVLQLDAHADLRQSYQGSRFSHACTMRRVREFAPAIQVGIRNLSLEEHNWVKRNKIRLFYAREKEKITIDQIIDSLLENVYLTFDLDFLDPSIMPSVGTPEPGGYLWYETLELLRAAAQKVNIVGFDIVELCPQPGNIAPDFLAAKMIYKLIGYVVNK